MKNFLISDRCSQKAKFKFRLPNRNTVLYYADDLIDIGENRNVSEILRSNYVSGYGLLLKQLFYFFRNSLAAKPRTGFNLSIFRGVAIAKALNMEDGLIGSFGRRDGCTAFTLPPNPNYGNLCFILLGGFIW